MDTTNVSSELIERTSKALVSESIDSTPMCSIDNAPNGDEGSSDILNSVDKDKDANSTEHFKQTELADDVTKQLNSKEVTESETQSEVNNRTDETSNLGNTDPSVVAQSTNQREQCDEAQAPYVTYTGSSAMALATLETNLDQQSNPSSQMNQHTVTSSNIQSIESTVTNTQNNPRSSPETSVNVTDIVGENVHTDSITDANSETSMKTTKLPSVESQFTHTSNSSAFNQLADISTDANKTSHRDLGDKTSNDQFRNSNTVSSGIPTNVICPEGAHQKESDTESANLPANQSDMLHAKATKSSECETSADLNINTQKSSELCHEGIMNEKCSLNVNNSFKSNPGLDSIARCDSAVSVTNEREMPILNYEHTANTDEHTVNTDPSGGGLNHQRHPDDEGTVKGKGEMPSLNYDTADNDPSHQEDFDMDEGLESDYPESEKADQIKNNIVDKLSTSSEAKKDDNRSISSKITVDNDNHSIMSREMERDDDDHSMTSMTSKAHKDIDNQSATSKEMEEDNQSVTSSDIRDDDSQSVASLKDGDSVDLNRPSSSQGISESQVKNTIGKAGQILSLLTEISGGSQTRDGDLMDLIKQKLYQEIVKKTMQDTSSEPTESLQSKGTATQASNADDFSKTGDTSSITSEDDPLAKSDINTDKRSSISESSDDKMRPTTGENSLSKDDRSMLKATDENKAKVSKDKSDQKLVGKGSENLAKKKDEPVVIDLDEETEPNSKTKTLMVRGEITPVKQARPGLGPTPNKTPGPSPRSTKNTPGKGSSKKNFIENLIAKGIPIIIPDDDENVPQERSKEYKLKLAQQQSEKSMSTFGDLVERSGKQDSTQSSRFTPPRGRPPAQRYDMSSPEAFRQRPIAPKPMSPPSTAQAPYSYQQLPPRRQLLPYQEMSQTEMAMPAAAAQNVQSNVSTQYSSSALHQQYIEPTTNQYHGLTSQSYAGGANAQTYGSSPQQQYVHGSQQHFVGQSPQRLTQTVGETSQLHYARQSPQRRSVEETSQVQYVGPNSQRPPVGDTSQVHYIVPSPQRRPEMEASQLKYYGQSPQRPRPIEGQSPQRPSFGQNQQRPSVGQNPQRQNIGQSPQRPSVGQNPQRQNIGQSPQRPRFDQRSQQPRYRPIAPSPQQAQPAGKRDISGTLVIIDDDTPAATHKPNPDLTIKQALVRKIKDQPHKKVSSDREAQGLLLPLVIRDVQSMAPAGRNIGANDGNESPRSVRHVAPETQASLPKTPVKVAVKQEPLDTHTDSMKTTIKDKQVPEPVPSKRDRPIEKPEVKAQTASEPPLKRIKIEPGAEIKTGSNTTPTLKEKERLDSSRKTDTPNSPRISTEDSTVQHTKQRPKPDVTGIKTRATKSDSFRNEPSPLLEQPKEKTPAVSPSKRTPEVILDIDVDDAETYRRNQELDRVLQNMTSTKEKVDSSDPEEKHGHGHKKKSGKGKSSKSSKSSKGHGKKESGKKESTKADVAVKMEVAAEEEERDKIDWSTKSGGSQKQFGCGDCGKTFETKKSLGQHFKIHTREQPFECDVCGRHYSLKTSLKKHIYTHFDEQKE